MNAHTPLSVALDYIGRGWSPVPIPYRTKKPLLKEWPALRIGEADAPRYFNGQPQNVGVILGEASSGLTDVDLDCAEAVAVAPWVLPATNAIFGRPSRRSSHWLYVTALASEFEGKTIEFHDPTLGRTAGSMLVELRIGGGGKGAQTVMPGSTHETGEAIAWAARGAPSVVDGSDLRQRVERLAAAALLTRYWSDGKRHQAALILGGMLARSGWKPGAVEAFIDGVAQAAGDPDVSDRKKAAKDAALNFKAGGKTCGFPKLKELFGEPVAKALATWLRYEPIKTVRDSARHSSDAIDDDPSSPGNNVPLISEDEAGLLFAEQYRGRLKFCADHGTWFRWDGYIWRQNKNGLAFHLCREMVRRMAEDESEKVRIAAGKLSFSSAVERFARADRVFAVTAEVWDRDPMLLGTPAGTVDLRTGELRAAKPEDAITRSTSVVPVDAADCPLWLKFLDETFGGDADLIAFSQRWAGYCLTGLTQEHALVFGHGPGGNGKSVFVNALTGILSSYAVTAAMDTFIASHGDRHSTDLAMLRGARLVTASETEEGRQWAESRIKQITGGDPVTARFMRQDNFTYVPTFKLFIIGNHKPGLRNVDDAARRRFNLVPFVRKPVVPDRQLEEKLKGEWPAILRWAIEGCIAWQRDGLAPPDSVREATEAYFGEQDTFSAWLEEDCEVTPENRHRTEFSADLYAAWQRYAKAAGEAAMSRKAFGERMQRTGVQALKGTGGVRMYRGIRLRPHARLEGGSASA